MNRRMSRDEDDKSVIPSNARLGLQEEKTGFLLPVGPGTGCTGMIARDAPSS